MIYLILRKEYHEDFGDYVEYPEGYALDEAKAKLFCVEKSLEAIEFSDAQKDCGAYMNEIVALHPTPIGHKYPQQFNNIKLTDSEREKRKEIIETINALNIELHETYYAFIRTFYNKYVEKYRTSKNELLRNNIDNLDIMYKEPDTYIYRKLEQVI